MTRTKADTKTIQTWPSGTSFTYRGDPDGQVNQRSLRLTARNNDVQEPWRKGTAAEWRQIRIALRAELYAEREVLCCDSALVDELVKAGTSGSLPGDLQGFSIDDMENLYPDPYHWDAPECLEWLKDNGYDVPDMNKDEAIEELRDLVRDHAEPAEVFEWWRVSDWLCKQLRDVGQVVIDNNYGSWWGRCTTGQGFIMDGVLQQVAAKFERDN